MAMSEFTHDQPETFSRTAPLSSVLTIEVALYAALAIVALFLRFFLLGNAPLAADEARQALAAWNFVRGIPDPFTGSPLLFTGNAIVFFFFGATDAAARVVPALFGSALVFIPTLLRRELGRTGALIASLLLTLSPSLIFFSRNDNGAILAVTCALAAVAFAWRYLNDNTSRDLQFAAMSSALALLAAREVWTIVVAIAIFALIMRTRFALPAESKSDWRRAAILFLIVSAGVGTTFALHREGIGAAFDLLGAWLGGLQPSIALSDPLRLLVVYEPIALFIGVAAMIQLAFAARPDEQTQLPLGALSLWFVVGFVLYSIGADKNPARVVVLVAPLTLVAGWYIGEWIENFLPSISSQVLLVQELPIYALACAAAGFLYLILADFATRGSFIAADVIANATGLKNGAGLVIVAMIVVVIAAVAFLMVITLGWARARDVGLAIALTLFGLWTIRQSAMLNYAQALNPREFLVARAPSPNVRDLVNDLQDTSRWRANDSYTLNIMADESLGAVVAWNLRDFRNLKFAAHPTSQNAQALILPPNAPAPASGWMSQVYWLETSRTATPNPSLLRWLMFRDVGEIGFDSAVLWIPQPK